MRGVFGNQIFKRVNCSYMEGHTWQISIWAGSPKKAPTGHDFPFILGKVFGLVGGFCGVPNQVEN